MDFIIHFFDPLQDFHHVALLLLRVVIAAIFIAHGPRKLRGKSWFMRFIGVMETIGGLALIFGFLTQFASLGLSIIMFGALYKKLFEWNTPFASTEKMGWEFDLLILTGCLFLMIYTGGTLSVDYEMFGI